MAAVFESAAEQQQLLSGSVSEEARAPWLGGSASCRAVVNR
jgi:hypothetical protein